MNRAKLIAMLQQIKALAGDCLKEVSGRSARHKIADPKVTDKPSPAKTLPVHILRLREEGFFKQGKTASEVRRKLQGVYPCDLDRVAMSLLRLRRGRELRKTSKIVEKRKQVAYVW